MREHALWAMEDEIENSEPDQWLRVYIMLTPQSKANGGRFEVFLPCGCQPVVWLHFLLVRVAAFQNT